jgi:hypothetical protein
MEQLWATTAPTELGRLLAPIRAMDWGLSPKLAASLLAFYDPPMID